MEWLLEIALLGLLATTLFHAMRLERALGVLKRDRAALEQLVAGFNSSTRAAEHGIERLRAAAEGAGRQVQRQAEAASALKEDLLFLTERGEKLADRLDVLVRSVRPLAQDLPVPPPIPTLVEPSRSDEAEPRLRSQAERDLLRALRLAR
jgi:chromosome segregation ATPase